MWILYVLIGFVVVAYIVVKIRFNITVRHELMEVNIDPQKAADIVNDAFGGDKPWKFVNGPGDINRKYENFLNVVEGPTISVAFETLENGEDTHVDIWMSDGVIITRKQYFIKTEQVKFEGKVRSIKRKIVRSLAEYSSANQA